MSAPDASTEPVPAGWPKVILAWVCVALPLAWGVWNTLKKAAQLFE